MEEALETKDTGKGGFGKNQKLTALGLAAILGLGPAMLVPTVSMTPYSTGFYYFLMYAAAVFAGGTMLTRRYSDGHEEERNRLMHDEVLNLVNNYNSQVHQLESEYHDEKKQQFFGTSELKAKYREAYGVIERGFNHQKHIYLDIWKDRFSQQFQLRSFWGWLFVILLVAMVWTFIGSAPATDSASASSLAHRQTGEVTYWNAENIPIPYLQDATQYVSNPDHVLSQQAVSRINKTMKRLEDSLNVQSVVIVVKHIENDDPFRMAQDVGNHYGVGHRDRGLLVVVGYEDHSINISPGRGLEGELTDAECRQLQQQYAIPFMRAELPDSAMVYITDAIYAKLQGKEMPRFTFKSAKEALEEDMSMSMGLYSCFLMVLLILFVYKNKVYQWMGGAAAMSIISNPFIETASGSGFFVGGGGGRGGGFSGGGFSSGGSFGGGSFGGGGATSRW